MNLKSYFLRSMVGMVGFSTLASQARATGIENFQTWAEKVFKPNKASIYEGCKKAWPYHTSKCDELKFYDERDMYFNIPLEDGGVMRIPCKTEAECKENRWPIWQNSLTHEHFERLFALSAAQFPEMDWKTINAHAEQVLFYESQRYHGTYSDDFINALEDRYSKVVLTTMTTTCENPRINLKQCLEKALPLPNESDWLNIWGN